MVLNEKMPDSEHGSCRHRLTVFPGRFGGLQQGGQPDVVLRHDPVEHVIETLGVRHRQLIELDEVFLDERELRSPVEDGASVDVLPLVLGHRLRPRFWGVDARVAVRLQFGQEEVVELVHLHLLEVDDVGRVVSDLLEDALLSVVPVQRPARTIAVHLPGRVFITQHIITHHSEDT